MTSDLRIPACDPFAPSGPGRAFLVAEVGNNHEGDLDAARAMVREAARAGADAVKFQTFRTEGFVHPSDTARVARLKKFELPPSAFRELAQEARAAGIHFFSTPLDLESADVLEPLVWAFKVASGDNDFTPLLERVAESGKPVIVSTGMTDVKQVERAVLAVRDTWHRRGETGKLALLHCVSAYPAPPEDANLRSIATLREHFPDVSIGYSDHTMGIEACIAAATLGARIIEKHFTLDKNASDFRDHQLSADPSDMRKLADGIATVSKLLGTPGKALRPSESGNDPAIRRSIHVRKDLPSGHVLTMADLAWLRPGGGMPSSVTREIVGRRTRRPLLANERLTPDALEG